LLYLNSEEVTTSMEAILAMKTRVFDHERFTLEEYLTVLAQNVWKFQSIGLDIQGETLEEKCESCMAQLIEHGLVKVAH
jgi:hypothetical protein